MTDETEPSSPVSDANFPGGVWAVRLGAGLLAGFLIIVVWSSIDRFRRPRLETVEQNTGVEDKVYFQIPAVVPAHLTMAVYLDDRPLFPLSYKPVSIHDSDVRRVAKVPSSGLTIYEAADENGSRRKERDDTWLLKAGPGQYVKVRPESAGK